MQQLDISFMAVLQYQLYFSTGKSIFLTKHLTYSEEGRVFFPDFTYVFRSPVFSVIITNS